MTRLPIYPSSSPFGPRECVPPPPPSPPALPLVAKTRAMWRTVCSCFAPPPHPSSFPYPCFLFSLPLNIFMSPTLPPSLDRFRCPTRPPSHTSTTARQCVPPPARARTAVCSLCAHPAPPTHPTCKSIEAGATHTHWARQGHMCGCGRQQVPLRGGGVRGMRAVAAGPLRHLPPASAISISSALPWCCVAGPLVRTGVHERANSHPAPAARRAAFAASITRCQAAGAKGFEGRSGHPREALCVGCRAGPGLGLAPTRLWVQ